MKLSVNSLFFFRTNACRFVVLVAWTESDSTRCLSEFLFSSYFVFGCGFGRSRARSSPRAANRQPAVLPPADRRKHAGDPPACNLFRLGIFHPFIWLNPLGSTYLA